MTHKPTILDIKTDILRAITSSYGEKGVNDPNHKHFLESAISKTKVLKLDKHKFDLMNEQLGKYKKNRNNLPKSREDLLLIASII